jgi:hypothetical protein
MLVAMNGDRTLFGEASSDSIGALAFLAPDRTRPKSPFSKIILLMMQAPRGNGDAARIGQHYDISRGYNQFVKDIEFAFGNIQEALGGAARIAQFTIR